MDQAGMETMIPVSSLASINPSVIQPIVAKAVMLSSNYQTTVVGAAWLISSAFFTTYSTTAFLKFGMEDNESHARTPFSRKSPRPWKGAGYSTTLPLVSKLPQSQSILSRVLGGVSRPTLLTLCRFSGSLALGLLLHADVSGIAHRVREAWRLAPSFALSAIFLFIANYCNSVSLQRIGISLTYTSKCMIPVITVLLTIFLDGLASLPNFKAILCLVPIVFGIAAASWNSPTFELIGFTAAVLSSAAQSALNVVSKRNFAATGVSGPIGQRVMVAISLVITVTMLVAAPLLTAAQDMVASAWHRAGQQPLPATPSAKKHRTSTEVTLSPPPLWLALLASVSYHVEYVLSFTFVRLVSAISYGTLDAVRRLGIILVGRALFGGAPLQPLNWIGILCALAGALGYSITSSSR
jgi:drug/metabolite transporter (DMT)-like permease